MTNAKSKQEVLYVTYADEPLEEGVSYAIYLSHLLGESLRVALLGKRRRFEDLMAAAAFAEENEPQMARELMETTDGGVHQVEPTLPPVTGKEEAARDYFLERCRNEGVSTSVHCGLEATAADILRVATSGKIDMILLSPKVTNTRNILKKLVKSSPRPVVTMASDCALPGRELPRAATS